MAILTTGLIKNTEVSGVRPSLTFSVSMTNPELINASIQIRGFYLNGLTRTEYVSDVITVEPGGVAKTNHYAKFDEFEFRFITSSDAVEISTWGEDAAGNLSLVYPLLPADLFSLGTSSANPIYVVDSGRNAVAVINEKTNSVKNTIKVGSGPYGIGVNPKTNLVYVSNSRNNNVSVLDGSNNTIIATITVGTNPKGVSVNPATNRIYVTNQGSNNVSVIDGQSHGVIATITVGTSPEGIHVNPKTNRIYVTNVGSNNVSVINGSINTVIATVEIGS